MPIRTPEITLAQQAAFKLHAIEIIYQEPLVTMYKNDRYIARWNPSLLKWSIFPDNQLLNNIDLLNSILGPNSAY